MSTKNIVLLHGWGSSTIKLEPLAQALASKKWNVYTLKLPGFEAPPPKTAWGVSDYADYAYEMAQKYFKGQSFYVFGHSNGGRMTIKLASEDLKDLEGVILCCSAGISRGNPMKRVFFWSLAKAGKVFNATPPLNLLARKAIYKLAREHDYEKTQGVMKEIFKKMVEEDLKPITSNIKIPTLILWGEIDRMTPLKDAYYLKKHIKNSKLETFPEIGHRLPYLKPEEVAESINKWAR